MQMVTKGKNRKFVSDWLPVVAAHNYQVDHNLGTDQLIIEIQFSPDNGATVHKLCNHNDSDGPSYGAGVFSIGTDSMSVNTMANGVAVTWNNGAVLGQATGWYRIIALSV
jgi:hypothetical protein